ncbi:DNA topoisomerase 3 [Isobaculum melis]|uniref:DNA topoisomerase n=1 Tax=Isobaculum melis TaxID=142588 RepID=A0A1H9UHB1_9LACT|nr:DNA topoisomerase 3 [Isobaculum melis]SES08574.1 DNA topoisomerase-3 [Isobaculum melis]
MKTLVIAEKPSVGRGIARVLGATQKSKAYIEGKDYIVTWGLGHLLGLKMPEDYKKEWATWEMNALPIMPQKMEIKPLKNTAGQLKAIKQLAARKDVDSAIIATDAGREGELVARWILQYVHFKKPVKRLWISSQTDKAIKDGFKQLKPSKAYDHLFYSAQARAESDWLIGLNVTRALTVKYQDSLSAGRVQTPTLAMVRKQEEKIEKFVPKTYFTIDLMIDGEKATISKGQAENYPTKEAAEQVIKELDDAPIIVADIQEKTVKEPAPLPYDLTELQKDANQRYQFSAKKTLNLMQALYEKHKVLTYPRTDSKHLTTDMVQTMKERLQSVQNFSPEAKEALKKGGKITNQRVFNNSKVTDHHGIIPTEERPRPEKMDSDELKIYRMVVSRFIGLFLPEYVVKKVTYTFKVKETYFALSSSQVLEEGWRVGNIKETGKKHLYQKGDQVRQSTLIASKHLTEAPSRLTEATLLQKMEKFGLGTPATRAEIIEKLISSDLMDRTQAKLTVSPKGKQLLSLVNPKLISPELTSKWERELEDIAKGKASKQAFIQSIVGETKALVQEIKNSKQSYQDFSLTQKKCPDCGELLKEKNGRDGKYLVCSSQTCQYRRRKDPKVSMRRCPQCHKKMEIHEGKAGAYFKCKFCNIAEKAADKKNKKMSKHEEKRMLKKYSAPDEPMESPLAAALKAAMKED